MSTYSKKFYKDYPVRMHIRSPHHWWQTINTAFTEDGELNVEMKEFEGLEHNFRNPLLFFPHQELLDHSSTNEQVRLVEPYIEGTTFPYADGVTDINVVGTLTEDNGVYSGFSTANYLQTGTSPIATDGGEWECMVKFTTGSDVSTNQKIFHALPSEKDRYGLVIIIISGKINYTVCSTGSKWLFDTPGSHTLSANTTYWVRFSYKNQKYLGEISTDGATFEEDYSVSNTSTLKTPLNYLRFGIYYSSKFEAPMLGSIDLKGCYFKAGDKILWNYGHTKYYEGCLDGLHDVSYEKTYTAFANAETALLTDKAEKDGFVWCNSLKIPAHGDYPTYTSNFLRTGAIALSDTYVASGFEKTSYLKSKDTINLGDYSTWSVEAKVRATTLGKYQFWFHGVGSFGLDKSNYLHSWVDNVECVSDVTFINGAWYYVKLEFTGTEYKMYYKARQVEEWVQCGSVAVTTAPTVTGNIHIGINPNTTSEYLYGEVSLPDYKFIGNGNVVWTPFTENSTGGDYFPM